MCIRDSDVSDHTRCHSEICQAFRDGHDGYSERFYNIEERSVSWLLVIGAVMEPDVFQDRVNEMLNGKHEDRHKYQYEINWSDELQGLLDKQESEYCSSTIFTLNGDGKIIGQTSVYERPPTASLIMNGHVLVSSFDPKDETNVVGAEIEKLRHNATVLGVPDICRRMREQLFIVIGNNELTLDEYVKRRDKGEFK